MTNYRGNFLYGFIACGPYEVLPEWVFDKVFCPPVETDPVTGEAKVAQVGLRRVESGLLQGYKKGDAPELMHCFVKNIQNIPIIEGPTVNSLIEAMRGCGRGCDFCDVNKRSKKDLPLERLKHEAKINLDYGFDSIWLHSDEMLLYGCDNREFIPNRDYNHWLA